MFSTITLLRAMATEGESSYSVTTVMYGLQAALWEWIALKRSVDAIRYLDPSWNRVDLGGILCPSIFYGIGICEFDYTDKDQAGGRGNQ